MSRIFQRRQPDSGLLEQTDWSNAGEGAPASNRLRRALVLAARVAAGWTIAMGVIVLIGWAADIGVIKSIRPPMPQMNPLTAGMFVVAGAALWLSLSGRTLPARLAAAILIAVGAFRLAGSLLPLLDFGLEARNGVGSL